MFATNMLWRGSSKKALQFVGANLVNIAPGSTDVSIPLTGLSGGLASSASQGDMVLVIVGIAGADLDMATKLTNTGWTLRTEQFIAGGAYNTNVGYIYRTMPSSPPTSVTLSNGTGSSTQPGVAIVMVWRNVKLTSITGLFNGNSNTASYLADPGIPYASPSTTPAVLIGFAFGSNRGTAGSTFLYSSSFYAGNFQASGSKNTSSPYNGIAAAVGWTPWVSGADDAPQFTVSSPADSTNGSFYAGTIILEAA